MKKPFLLAGLGLALLAAQPAAAQYYVLPNTNTGQNPGGRNADGEGRFDTGLPGWTLLLTGTAATQATPAWTAVQPMPFAFQVGGQSFNSYKVSSSGVLTFTTAATAVPPTLNTALPSADVPANSLGIWGVLMTASNDFLISKTFGTAPNRQHWVQFNSVSLPQGTTSSPITNGFLYASIVLEETTNRAYLVWQRSGPDAQSLTAGLQLNGTTAYQAAASPNVSIPDLGSALPDDNQFFSVVPGVQPALDLSPTSLALPNTAARNGSVSIRGTFSNLGTSTVSSFTANYRVDNGPVQSAPLTGYATAALGSDVFMHPVPFVPTTGGIKQVKAWLSLPNGSPDQQPANDTVRGSFVVADSTMRRKVVQEDFTSSTCPPCRGGNINTRAINTQAINRGKFVEIKYQQDFPGPIATADPYYTAEGVARRNLYGINAIPYMMLDGGWNQNSVVYTAAILNQFQARPALARIAGAYTLTAATNTLAATASIKPLFAVPAGRLVAHMAVTERETRRNARTNGETRFYDVMKKMLPNQNGTPLPALASGQSFGLSQTFNAASLPATQAVENFDSLQVVVWVQDLLTKEVYQGESLTLVRPTGTRRAQSGPAFALVPNPAAGRSTLALTLARPATVRVDVLDGLGRLVLARPAQPLAAGPQELALDLSRQAPGLYTVRLVSEQGVSTQKLTLE